MSSKPKPVKPAPKAEKPKPTPTLCPQCGHPMVRHAADGACGRALKEPKE